MLMRSRTCHSRVAAGNDASSSADTYCAASVESSGVFGGCFTIADCGTTCASDVERAGTRRIVTPFSLQSAGSASNFVGSLNGFQNSPLLAPETAIALTP